MIDIENYLGRLLALNVQEGYLDEFDIILYRGARLCLNLNKFLGSIEDDLEGAVIEIPEVIEKVYYNVYELLDNTKDKHFTIIFPSTLSYYGSMYEEIEKETDGVIQIRDTDFFTSNNRAFNNTIFDFTKCIKLKYIYERSFVGQHIGGLYLPITLTGIGNRAFLRATIKEFIGKGVDSYGFYCFSEANLQKFESSGYIKHADTMSLAFESYSGALIFNNLSGIVRSLFGDLRRLYLPYNLDFMVKVADRLSKAQEYILKERYDIDNCEEELYQIKQMIDDMDTSHEYDYQCAVLEYIKKDREYVVKLISEFFCNLRTQVSVVYLYNINSPGDLDNRNYKLISRYDGLSIYIER